MIRVPHSKAEPHGELEEKEGEDHDEDQRVPLPLDLNRQAAQVLQLLWHCHALDDKVDEEHWPQADTSLAHAGQPAHNRKEQQSEEAEHPEAEEVTDCSDRLLCVCCMGQMRHHGEQKRQ